MFTIKEILFFLLLLSVVRPENGSKTRPTPERPPNVILIFTDDQGYGDVGIFGAKDIKTPHLDKLASEGVVLTSFYAAQAVCSASRAGILTGCYPNRIGMHNALMPQSEVALNHSETTIAEMLNSKGYRTAIFGKWHLGDHPDYLPTKHGFDEFYGIPYSNDMWTKHPQQGKGFNFGPLPLFQNETVVDTLTEQSELTTRITEYSVDFIKRNKEHPFFLYVPHPQPHVPLFVSGKFRGLSERGLYGDVIMEIDWSVGQIMDALKEEGLDENTIVIFTSDNGPWLAYGNHAGNASPFREGKGTAWEGGHREPFILRYPEKLKAGARIDTPVMAIDILPTLAYLTGAPLPHRAIDGKNVWSVITGNDSKGPQKAYFFYFRVNELHGVRYGRWKLYFPHRYRTMKDQQPGKDGLPGKYSIIDLRRIALYDVVSDPGETKDVASQNPEIVTEIERLADGMRERLGDALKGVEGKENRAAAKVIY